MARITKFIRLSRARRNAYVYRFVAIEHLYQLFETGKNVVVSPKKWDDPFENFILQGQKVSGQGWFGQCWTHHRASDAMWRIYSKDSRGVRIRSTPSRLAGTSLPPGWHAFVGEVEYLSEKPRMRFAQSALRRLDDVAEVAKTLLVKRPAFRHEAEVRLLLFRSGHSTPDGVVKYTVDPNALIDQVMLHPRIAKIEAEQLKEEIRERAKFKGSIKRSLLYSPPPVLLDLPTAGPPSNKRLQPSALRANVKRRG